MKTIRSYPLFGYQLKAGKLIASTSQSTRDSSFMDNSVPHYISSPLLLLIVILGVGGVLALTLSSAIKVANEWERLVVLRLGKFLALKGPGLVFIIPVIDTIPYRIDTRVITTSFQAEKDSD